MSRAPARAHPMACCAKGDGSQPGTACHCFATESYCSPRLGYTMTGLRVCARAVATSAALGFPIALANVVGYVVGGQGVNGLPPASLGYIWLPGLAVIATCSVLTAPLGAKAAHSLPVRQLKRVFASLLFGLAAYMLWKGLSAL